MANGVTNPDIIGQFLRGRAANQQSQLFQQQLSQQQADQDLLGQQREQQQKQLQLQQQTQQQTQQLRGQILSGQDVDANLQKLFTSNPEAAEGVLNSMGLIDQRKRDQASNFAFDLINTAPDQRSGKIQARANSLQAQGRNPADTLSLENLSIEQQDNALRTIQQAALSTKERFTQQERGRTKKSASLAEFEALTADLSPEQKKRAVLVKLGLSSEGVKLTPLQQKVAAEGINPNSKEGFARARELNQGSRTDPSLKPSDQKILSKATEGQLASAGFANRVKAANETLTDLTAKPDFDPTSITQAAIGSIPGGNIFISSDTQEFLQAKRDFITAVLRKESGAAIGVDEFANEEQKFFPQIGDKPAVLKRKAEGRARAFENLEKQSKGVFGAQFKGDPSDQGVIMEDASGNRARVFDDGRIEEL